MAFLRTMAFSCAVALACMVAPAAWADEVVAGPAVPANLEAPAEKTAPAPAAARAPSRAADRFDAAPAPEDGSESLVGTLLRTLLVLGIVLGLVYVSLNYGLRRLMGLRGLPTGRSTLVKVIERIPLDPKRSLFVVQAAGEYLLIGGGDDGLNLLGKLDSTEVDRVLEQQLKQAQQISPFLQKLLSRKGGTPPANKV